MFVLGLAPRGGGRPTASARTLQEALCCAVLCCGSDGLTLVRHMGQLALAARTITLSMHLQRCGVKGKAGTLMAAEPVTAAPADAERGDCS
jgi:hypothetical protein